MDIKQLKYNLDKLILEYHEDMVLYNNARIKPEHPSALLVRVLEDLSQELCIDE